MRRTLVYAAVIALVTAACGQERADQGSAPAVPAVDEEVAEEPATTTTERVTTTTVAPTTTERVTTTTAPPPPWTLVEFPAWPDPMLSELVGGPLPLASMCVDLQLTNYELDSSAPHELAALLGLLGIDVLDAGDPACDVTLTVVAEGSRTSAQYIFDGTRVERCWSGIRATGSVTMSIDGAVIGEWPIDVDKDPPDSVRGCAAEDAPLISTSWSPTVLRALIDALGATPAIVNDLGLAGDDATAEQYQAMLADPGYPELLAAALGHPAAEVREGGVRKLLNWADSLRDEPPPYPEALWATIPYLIACAEPADLDSNTGCYLATATLEQLFFRTRMTDELPQSFDTESRASWWGLWEANPTPPAVAVVEI